MKKIILFGCGYIGREALSLLGTENVHCFCDNIRFGMSVEGKSVISYPELLLESYQNYIIVISLNPGNTDSVISQLESDGITGWFPYLGIRGKKSILWDEKDVLGFFNKKENEYEAKISYYKAKYLYEKKQLAYLKEHSDIRTLKPATGSLRERQLELLDFVYEVLEELKELHIEPFLIGGSLLGAYRHGGFIPWDDDFDMGLMRADYDRLMEYFREKERAFFCPIPYKEQNGYNRHDYMKKLAQRYPGELLLDIDVDKIIIFKENEKGVRFWIDFFAFDYFREGYMLETHKRYLSQLEAEMRKMNYTEEIYQYLQREWKENDNIAKEKTNHIFAGNDSMDAHDVKVINRVLDWMKTDRIFPLKSVKFENTFFLAPQDEREVLEYEYGNYMEYPSELGNAKHGGLGDYLFE